MLTHQQNECINLLLQGEMKTNIKEKIGISRTTIYAWLDNPEFRAELNRREQQIKDFATKQINGKLNTAIEEFWDLRKKTTNEMVKEKIYTYFIDRALGKPTSKLDITAEAKTNMVDENTIDSEFDDWKSEEQ
jgi:hypothetical protein